MDFLSAIHRYKSMRTLRYNLEKCQVADLFSDELDARIDNCFEIIFVRILNTIIYLIFFHRSFIEVWQLNLMRISVNFAARPRIYL